MCPAFLAAALTAAVLTACNAPTTDLPMMKPDEASRAYFKPGVWSYQIVCPPGETSFRCDQVITTLAVTRTEARRILPPGMPSGPMDRSSFRYVIANGDPLLVQLELRGKLEWQDRETVEYGYAALEPKARDEAGYITAAKVWTIMCGPPPEPGDWNYEIRDEEGQRTNRPLDGMTMKVSGCVPRDLDALSAAAAPSRAYSAEFDLRYVRDGPE